MSAMYIDGQLASGRSRDTIGVIDPATEEV